MDQAPSRRSTCHDGLETTLKILGHKLRKGIDGRSRVRPHPPPDLRLRQRAQPGLDQPDRQRHRCHGREQGTLTLRTSRQTRLRRRRSRATTAPASPHKSSAASSSPSSPPKARAREPASASTSPAASSRPATRGRSASSPSRGRRASRSGCRWRWRSRGRAFGRRLHPPAKGPAGSAGVLAGLLTSFFELVRLAQARRRSQEAAWRQDSIALRRTREHPPEGARRMVRHRKFTVAQPERARLRPARFDGPDLRQRLVRPNDHQRLARLNARLGTYRGHPGSLRGLPGHTHTLHKQYRGAAPIALGRNQRSVSSDSHFWAALPKRSSKAAPDSRSPPQRAGAVSEQGQGSRPEGQTPPCKRQTPP